MHCSLRLYYSAFERQEPSSHAYTSSTAPLLLARLDALEESVRTELQRQGFSGTRVKIERMLNMRFDGTDTALMILPRADEKSEDGSPDYLSAFRRAYKDEFGFLLDTKRVMVDDVKVRVSVVRMDESYS